MDCHAVKERLSEYVDGMLPETETPMIEEHLARCADCLGEYESMVRIIEQMNQMETIDPPADFVEKVNTRLEKRSSLEGLFRRLFVPVRSKVPLELAGVAAALVLVIYLFGIFQSENLYEISMSVPGERRSVTTIPEKRGDKKRADKKGGEKGTQEEVPFEEAILSAGGKVVITEYRDNTKTPASMIIEIPAENYPTLLRELDDVGTIRKTPSRPPDASGKVIRVRITLVTPDDR